MSTSHGTARVAVPVLILLALAAGFGWLFYEEGPSAPGRTGLVAPAPGASPPAPAAAPPALPGAPSTAPSIADARPRGSDPTPATSGAPPGSADAAAAVSSVPSFDIVRVEPDGSSVVAGRALPNATVELRRNGAVLATGRADSSGAFAFVPPPLDPGTHELTLEAIAPDGTRAGSRQSVTAAIAANRTDRPLVTVTAPDQPTRILSEPASPPVAVVAAAPERTPAATPGEAARRGGTDASASSGSADPVPADAAKPAAPSRPLRIATVEAEGEGRLFVSGEAAPGTTLRLYLNDTFVAPGQTGPDGRLSFDIGRGIRPGEYKVRLDEVDPVTGAVRTRAEVPFTVPAPAVVAGVPPPVQSPMPNQPAGGATPPAGQEAGSSGALPATPGYGGTRPNVASGGPAAGAGPVGRPAAQLAAGDPARLASGDPGRVVVPEIATSIVSRGDSLWAISKRVYGAGLRYTVIYDANAPQIRNPDLIYPGQVFVLPTR